MLRRSTHTRLEASDGILTLWLDRADRRENRLDLAMLDDIERALAAVRESRDAQVLVLRSAKAAGFVHGIDASELRGLRGDSELHAWAARGQQVASAIRQLSPAVTTVAVIEGVCAGPGIELALACDHRVAVARPDTRFAFDEVRKGRIPCWGGTQALPRRVGIPVALEMLLEGRTLSAREAVRVGLIDDAFCARKARIELRSALDRLQDRPGCSLRRDYRPGFHWRKLTGIADMRLLLASERRVAAADDEYRTVAREVLRCVSLSRFDSGEGLVRERRSFARLMLGATADRMLEAARRGEMPLRLWPEAKPARAGMPTAVAVVGGGNLGTVLARWFALRGLPVLLKERDDAGIVRADRRLETLMKEAVQRGWVTPLESQEAARRIRRTTRWAGVEEATLVIEAVDEEVGLKQQIFHELEGLVSPEAVLATTSSTVSVERIAAELNAPERVLGIHFPGEVDTNPIIELVRGRETSTSVLHSVDSWLRQWGWSPVLVGDRPGRVVLPLMMTWMAEAVQLVSEGLDPAEIDEGMRKLGMKTGPLEMIDTIGFARLADLTRNLHQARGDRFAAALLLERPRAAGLTGRIGSEGFYTWGRRGKAASDTARMALWTDGDEDAHAHYHFDPEQSLQDGIERLVMRTINHAAAMLDDETEADPASIDRAMSLGAGWLPMRGGPLRLADDIGLPIVVERLYDLAERYGKRFEPCAELRRRAEAGETFHGLVAARPNLAARVLRRAG